MNYRLITGPFIGEVVEDGAAILDVNWGDLDSDMQERIIMWCEDNNREISTEPTPYDIRDYELSWEMEETEEPITMKPLSEW